MSSALPEPSLSFLNATEEVAVEALPRLHAAEPDVLSRLRDVPGHRQKPLSEARILFVGAGGLNCWAALGLARSGATNITIVDHDLVEITNLSRQPYRASERGLPKAHSLARMLADHDHMVLGGKVTAIAEKFDEEFLQRNEDRFDLMVVGVDNDATRLLAAGRARNFGTPTVFAGLSLSGGFRCYAFLQGPGTEDACLHCARPDLRPEENAPCSSVTVAGCFAASSLALFFAYRALMGWPEGTEPFNYRELDLLGDTPDVKGFVKARGDCPTCSGFRPGGSNTG